MSALHRPALALGLAAALALPAGARAAPAFDSCTGFIDALPAVIGTQGTWCLRKDLATNIQSGGAITVTANNVTVDCNGFKLGGLATPERGSADGLRSLDRMNTTVRDCHVRGFRTGLHVTGGGHEIRGNRIEGPRSAGIIAAGDNLVVRDNLLLDVASPTLAATGIQVEGNAFVLDNVIKGVSAAEAEGIARGIRVLSGWGSLQRNTIHSVVPGPGGTAYGILVETTERYSLRDNLVAAPTGSQGTGLRCSNPGSPATDNLINGFGSGMLGCENAGGNDYQP